MQITAEQTIGSCVERHGLTPCESGLAHGKLDERGRVLIIDVGNSKVVTRGMEITDHTQPTPVPQDAQGIPRNERRRGILHIRNFGGGDATTVLYIGGATLTPNNGYPIPADEEIVLDITDRVQVYTIVDENAPVDVRTLEIV